MGIKNNCHLKLKNSRYLVKNTIHYVLHYTKKRENRKTRYLRSKTIVNKNQYLRSNKILNQNQ